MDIYKYKFVVNDAMKATMKSPKATKFLTDSKKFRILSGESDIISEEKKVPCVSPDNYAYEKATKIPAKLLLDVEIIPDTAIISGASSVGQIATPDVIPMKHATPPPQKDSRNTDLEV